MRQIFRTKSFRISAVIALLLIAYALAGFLLAPKLLRDALLKEIPKTLVGVTPTVGEIHVNPFLMKIDIKDFYLSGSQGTKLVGFKRFFVDFELSSILHRAYTFSHIDIEEPFANAVIFKDGSLNLTQLSPPSKAQAPAKKEPIPALRIGSFKVSQGFLAFDDRRRPSDFTTRIAPLNFELQNFTTGIEGGRFTFTGVSKLGERVEWHGHASVQPIESDGEFRIDGLQAHTIWSYLEDQLSFLISTGKIDLNGTYKFSLQEQIDLKVDLAKVALSDLTVRPKGADADWLTVPQLLVTGTHLDLQKRAAHTDSLTISGVKLTAWLEADGSLNLLKLAAAPPPVAPALPMAAAAAAPATVATAGEVPGPAWKYELAEFALRDASISVEDRRTRPAAALQLAPLSISVHGASLDLAKPVTVALEANINSAGTLNVSGEVTPQPAAAKLNLKLDGIDLAAVQPYIAQYTSMTLLSGKLSGDGKMVYQASQPTLAFGGSLSVANLHTIDNALRADFINWDRLDVQGLNVQYAPNRLDIDQVIARKLYARVIIEPDESINVKRVLAAPGATVVAPSGSSAPAIVATAPPAPAAPLPRKGGKSAHLVAAAPAVVTNSAAAMPMSIKKIVLQNGETDFADLSVNPNFATGIKNLQGTVLGLSTKENSRAKIDIKGSVDEFAPVAINGEVNVLGAVLYTDVALSFHNIELSTFNPYSGKFAGYNISKGKLSTDLHYKVEGRKLDAQHHIVVDQLEFGAKTESKDAVSLPVKLAVALLKDREGVIDLNLPVAGSLDDPKFKIGPIIWKVFVNILEKAVSAPFALLGSLFGGGPDLQFVDFQPGFAQLDPAGTEKAQSLVKALNARPQLKIEIPIAVVNDLDRPRLIDAKLQTQLRDAQAGSRKRSAAAVSFEQLDPGAQLELLAQVYEKNTGSAPKYPESVAALKGKPEQTAAKIEFLNGELRAHTPVGEAELTALGQQRAMNLQQALLNGTQIDAERVFLVANDKAKNEAGRVRLELSLR